MFVQVIQSKVKDPKGLEMAMSGVPTTPGSSK